ncbi:hypothetical protein [Rhodococcus globerulus]|uniref:hypothetical protein n=1 Tax=Rhodococcus globerulus TaxID=33008 RepID=UPI00301B07E5
MTWITFWHYRRVGNEEFWTDEDEQAASAAWWRRFPNGDASWIRADVDTGREWGGYAKGLWTGDSRIPLKNNGEYHGMERHAWQYLATGQYSEASDYFYCAALMRREDAELVIIGPADAGHVKAIVTCLKMARFSRAVGRFNWDFVVAEDHGLDPGWIERRIMVAEQVLGAASEQVLGAAAKPPQK